MNDLHVIGIDPGVTTGLAHVFFHEFGDAILVDSAEKDFGDSIAWLRAALRRTNGVERAIVVEKFIITARTASINAPGDSLEMIGAARLLARDVDLPLHRQAPSEAKSLVSNEMLRQIGLWERGTGGHSIDAMRHATLYAVRHGWVPSHMMESS